MSPDTSRPSTRKHWLPGVCPGVCTSSTATAPTSTRSPLSWATRWSAVDPGGPLDPGHLVALDVDGHLDPLEQGGRPLDGPPGHGPPQVVGVEVGAEHPHAAHAVGRQEVQQLADAVGRVD